MSNGRIGEVAIDFRADGRGAVFRRARAGERAMEASAPHAKRIFPHGLWDRVDAPAPARPVEVGAAKRPGRGMKF